MEHFNLMVMEAGGDLKEVLEHRSAGERQVAEQS